MGFLDEHNRLRDERIKRETKDIIDDFGGQDGCLKIIFFPITIPYYLIKYLFGPIILGIIRFIIGIMLSIIIIFLSLLIITPFKIILFLISFGYWNGFDNRNLSERLSDFWDWLNGIDVEL